MTGVQTCALPIYFYQWNPTSSAGTTEDKVLGVEDALWSEHLRSLNDAEFLMYTRMMATAEVGWTQQNRKDYDNWNKRVGDIAIDLMNRGANFHKATEVTSWKGSYAAVCGPMTMASAAMRSATACHSRESCGKIGRASCRERVLRLV